MTIDFICNSFLDFLRQNYYRGRLFRVLDSFYQTGQFVLSVQKRRGFELENQHFRNDYQVFKEYIELTPNSRTI